MVPTFTAHRSAKEVPDSAPAASPAVRRRLSRWPPHRPDQTGFGVDRHHVELSDRHALQPGPHLPDSSRSKDYGTSGIGSSRTPLRVARRTRPVWQCRNVPASSGLLPPSPATPGSGCPQLHQAAATAQRRGPFIPARQISASWRTAWALQTRLWITSYRPVGHGRPANWHDPVSHQLSTFPQQRSSTAMEGSTSVFT